MLIGVFLLAIFALWYLLEEHGRRHPLISRAQDAAYWLAAAAAFLLVPLPFALACLLLILVSRAPWEKHFRFTTAGLLLASAAYLYLNPLGLPLS